MPDETYELDRHDHADVERAAAIHSALLSRLTSEHLKSRSYSGNEYALLQNSMMIAAATMTASIITTERP